MVSRRDYATGSESDYNMQGLAQSWRDNPVFRFVSYVGRVVGSVFGGRDGRSKSEVSFPNDYPLNVAIHRRSGGAMTEFSIFRELEGGSL